MRKNKGKPSARNKLYWINKGYSEVESITMARSRIPGTIEYFNIFKGNSLEKSQELSNAYWKEHAVTIENLIKRHGEKEGKHKFECYRKAQAYSNTLEYMIKKYGEEKGTEKYYSANKKRAVTIDNCIKNHGEENGKVIFNDYVEKQRVNGCKLEYFIEKYGEKEGTEFYKTLNIKKAITFDNLYKKYGDVEIATKKYSEWLRKIRENLKTNINFSKNSQDLFNEVSKKLIELGYNQIYYKTYNQEWYINIVDKNNLIDRFVFLDFFVKDTGKVIEFYGDYWHANPILYTENVIFKRPNGNITAKDIWKTDKERIDDIKKVPYIKDILIIWENEWNNNKEEITKKCIQFLIK